MQVLKSCIYDNIRVSQVPNLKISLSKFVFCIKIFQIFLGKQIEKVNDFALEEMVIFLWLRYWVLGQESILTVVSYFKNILKVFVAILKFE